MSHIKSLLKIHKVRVALALVAISFAVVMSFFLPKEADPNIGLTTNPETPTVGITHPAGTLMVNRSVDYRDVRLTVTKVEEAGAFSDDRKRAGTYTVRVNVHAQPGNNLRTAEEIDYASLVHLVLPNGQAVSPKLVSLLPVVLPGQPEDGFFDFPVTVQVPLASLSLRLGDETTVVFGT